MVLAKIEEGNLQVRAVLFVNVFYLDGEFVCNRYFRLPIRSVVYRNNRRSNGRRRRSSSHNSRSSSYEPLGQWARFQVTKVTPVQQEVFELFRSVQCPYPKAISVGSIVPVFIQVT